MAGKQAVRKFGRNVGSNYLEVSFGVSKDAHPQIYDFFLDHLAQILAKLKESECQITLLRLEPLNAMYSHLNVTNSIMQHIFSRFCKTHRLKAFAAFSPKQRFSCEGVLSTHQLQQAVEDYNLLFDLFFCDVRIQSQHFFIDAMDLFSNRILVQGNVANLKRFQRLVKTALPQTHFRLV